jgi:D-alanyl-D-alanine carboxypeptidase
LVVSIDSAAQTFIDWDSALKQYLTLNNSYASDQGMKPALQNALQARLDQSLLFAPGLGINVTLKDEKHGYWKAASGFAEPDTRTLMSLDGQFYIYSITKKFTAVAILQLAQDQKLSLDEPVSNWLPDLPFPPSGTIRRLLNHTSLLTASVHLNPSVDINPS